MLFSFILFDQFVYLSIWMVSVDQNHVGMKGIDGVLELILICDDAFLCYHANLFLHSNLEFPLS